MRVLRLLLPHYLMLLIEIGDGYELCIDDVYIIASFFSRTTA